MKSTFKKSPWQKQTRRWQLPQRSSSLGFWVRAPGMATSHAPGAGTAPTRQVPAGGAAEPLPDLRAVLSIGEASQKDELWPFPPYSNSLSVTCSQCETPSLPHRHSYVSVSCGTLKTGAPRRQVSHLLSTPAAPSSRLYTWLVFNTCYLFIYFYYYSWHTIVSVDTMVTWHLSTLWLPL